MSTRETLQHG